MRLFHSRGSSRVAEGKGRNCYRDAEPRRAAPFHGWDCILGLMRGGWIRLRGRVDVSDGSPVMEPGLGAAYPGRRRPG